MIIQRELYLEPSPTRGDGGNLVGRLPGKIPVRDLQALGHPRSPTRAIRAKCVDCSGGSEAEARKCTAVGCPLWAFRMGVSPFYGKTTAGGAEPSSLEGLA